MKVRYEYEIGDYITVLDSGWNDTANSLCKKIVDKNDTFKIAKFANQSNTDEYKVAIGEDGECVYIEQYNAQFRLATPGEIRRYDDSKKPKFKTGDYVVCLDSTSNQFTAGKVYIIRSISGNGKCLDIELDDRGSTKNGWHIDHFRLATDREIEDYKISQFKVGDIVMPMPKVSWWNKGGSFPAKILSIKFNCANCGEHQDSCYLGNLRLATNEEIKRYQREQIPEYAEFVRGTNDFTKGKIYKFPCPTYDSGYKSGIDVLEGSIWTFKPSTKEEYDAQNRKFKVGDWVYQINNYFVDRISNIRYDGWIIMDNHNDPTNYWNDQRFRLATNEEIESHLIAEAKRRGYKTGIRINSLSSMGLSIGWEMDATRGYQYNSNDDDLSPLSRDGSLDCTIYQRGQWAKFIADEPKYNFKIGDWVKVVKKIKSADADRYEGEVVKIGSINNFNSYGNGGYIGEYQESNLKCYSQGGLYFDEIRLATYDEVEKHLLEEAKKRGYVAGVRIKGVKNPAGVSPTEKVIDKVRFGISSETGYYLYSMSNYIYVEGQWATILKESFKVGDKVRILTDRLDKSFYSGAEYYLRDAINSGSSIFTVDHIGNNGRKEWDNQFIKLKGYDYSHPIDCFELVKEEPITIAGYGAKFGLRNQVSFGCRTYIKSDIDELIRSMERFKITNVTIDTGNDINIETIRKIRDRIK